MRRTVPDFIEKSRHTRPDGSPVESQSPKDHHRDRQRFLTGTAPLALQASRSAYRKRIGEYRNNYLPMKHDCSAWHAFARCQATQRKQCPQEREARRLRFNDQSEYPGHRREDPRRVDSRGRTAPGSAPSHAGKARQTVQDGTIRRALHRISGARAQLLHPRMPSFWPSRRRLRDGSECGR